MNIKLVNRINKSPTLLNMIIELVNRINKSPTLLNRVPFELFDEKDLKIIRDLLEEVVYKILEIDMKNKEIMLELLKNFDKKSVNESGKHSKEKNIKVINIKVHSKDDALSQLKKVLPKDIYDRIKKEMI